MLVITRRSLRFFPHVFLKRIYRSITYRDGLAAVSHLPNKAKVSERFCQLSFVPTSAVYDESPSFFNPLSPFAQIWG